MEHKQVKISNKIEESFGVILTNYLLHNVHFPYIRVPTDALVYILFAHKMKRMQSFFQSTSFGRRKKQVRKLGLAGPTQTILQNEEKKKVKL